MPGSGPAYLAGLFGDREVAAALDGPAQLAAMLRAEAALAAAQAELGLIPATAAEAVAALRPPEPGELAAATERDGTPVPGLVAALRAQLPGPQAQWLHYGATSQDIQDTALALCLVEVLRVLEDRLQRLGDALAALAEAHAGTLVAARTRFRTATPTSFGLTAAVWLTPLVRLRAQLAELRAEVLPVSLGGASGTQAALGPRAREVEQRMATRLGLPVAPLPWHARREGVAEAASWLVRLSGALGKIAQDVVLLSQSEVGELRLAGAGGSSTMPNKQNPTAAEAVVALARANAQQVGTLFEAQLHAHARDGAAWQAEWLALPEICIRTGAALRHALALVEGLEVRVERMRANLDAGQGLWAAEAASFALAAHMPRAEAQALVKAACREALDSGESLTAVLRRRTDAPLDWAALADAAAQLGEARAMIERAVAANAALPVARP
jgi:3-carboxy-cis,cis-muconate cycloisomerase